MVNEVLTFLANLTRHDLTIDLPGSFYISPDFRPRQLTGWLKDIRSTLYGPNATADKIAYRVYQFAQLLHGCELAEFVTEYDTRISYLPLETTPFQKFPSSEVYANNHTDPIYISGELKETNATLISQWRVSRLINTVNVQQLSGGSHQETYSAGFHDGLSAFLPFPGTASTFRIPAGAPASWTVTLYAKPKLDLALALRQTNDFIAGEHVEQVFTTKTPSDHTLRKIWFGHPAAVCRYGAMLLAISRRMKEQSSRNNT